MGGRGSGGGKSGGGTAKVSKDTSQPNSINYLKDKYRTKVDKIKYMNEVSGANLSIATSYSSKEIDDMFKQVIKGKKIKKLGYEYVVDYGKN